MASTRSSSAPAVSPPSWPPARAPLRPRPPRRRRRRACWGAPSTPSPGSEPGPVVSACGGRNSVSAAVAAAAACGPCSGACPVSAGPAPSAGRPPRVRRRCRVRSRRGRDSSPCSAAASCTCASPWPDRSERSERSDRPPWRDRSGRPPPGRRALPVSPRSSSFSASRPARVRSPRGRRPLVPSRDVQVGVEVRGGGVGLDRLGEAQVERLVDQAPAGQVVPVDEGDRDARSCRRGRCGRCGAGRSSRPRGTGS